MPDTNINATEFVTDAMAAATLSAVVHEVVEHGASTIHLGSKESSALRQAILLMTTGVTTPCPA